MSLVEKYLKEIGEKTKTGEYLFRGHSDAGWKLTSSAERRIAASIADGTSGATGDVPRKSIISSQTSLLEDARKLGLGRQDGRDLSDLELLTELQHFDAATVLLDFTENPLVALYFACRKMNEEERDRDTNGKVFCLPRNDIPKATDTLEIDNILGERKMKQWRPFMHGSAERRIIKQSSVFVLNLDASKTELTSVTICRDEKDELIKELSNTYGISTASLYIDLSGFASSRSAEVRYDDVKLWYYRGNKKYFESNYKAAIADYDGAIEIKPDHADAFNNRGSAKFKLGDISGSIADYSRAIELRPNYADAFYNRGNSMFSLGDLLGAIADYDRAIELNSKDSYAFNNRGNVKVRLEQLNDALADFNRSIELEAEYYNYQSRASLYIRLGKAALAEKDFQAMKTRLVDSSKHEKRRFIDDLKLDLSDEKDNDAVIDFIKRCIEAVESALES